MLKFEKHIKALEWEVETLSKLQNYSYEILMNKWAHNQVSEHLSEITLSPFGKSQFLRLLQKWNNHFSLMKLIDTHLQCHLSQENLAWSSEFASFDNYWSLVIK